ncbi:MAG: hypothetical protein IJH31_05245 [Erysipelotrichaceae bacterium]|nr:hypothetical protein [Erysipelotrichaceae bacterium]
MKWIDINEKPIKISGLGHIDKEKGEYFRLPLDVIDTISKNVSSLARCSASGRVRFTTNSKHLLIKYKVKGRVPNGILSVNANNYAALYLDNQYDVSCIKTYEEDESYYLLEANEGHLEMTSGDIMIYLPMRDSITEMEIGIDDDAWINKPRPYKYKKPIVFYGSSIVQGLCGSHSGRSYVDQVGRIVDSEYRNLGFSGCALGEDNIAKYIAGLDMSIFVFDYDHNAPSVKHLRDTHERFFKIFRSVQKDTPVIMISKPNILPWVKEDYERKEIIRKTYLNALENGDKNVYFIDGEDFFGRDETRYEYTEDALHPNDAGMNQMAKIVSKQIKEILEK